MTELSTINVALYAQTDVGMVRQGNEDNFLILDLSTGTSWSAGDEEPGDLLQFQQGYYGTLLAVSDGMGGALAGEVASRLAVETVRDRMLQLQAHANYGKAVPFHERLRLAVEEANSLIHADGLSNPGHKGLGATFTGVGIQGHHAYFSQVGDSRAHLIRQGKIARITKDQSLVQQLIDAGQITEEEAETHSYRNVILQALGAQNLVNVEVNSIALAERDILVLCSDGLSGKVSAHEVAEIVNHAGDFQTACQTLIALANQRGGEDNITVVIAQFFGEGIPPGPGDTIEPVGIARSPDTPTEINWAQGGDTDQLNDAATDPATATNEADVPSASASVTSGLGLRAKATTPLNTAPVPPPPAATTPLKQRTEPLERQSDFSDRRGPITAVYDISEFAEAAKPADIPEPDPALVSLRSAQADLLAQTEPGHTGDETVRHDNSEQANKTSRSGYALPIALVLLLLAGLSTGIFWYVNRQTQERKAIKEQQEQTAQANETLKLSLIASLNDKIKKSSLELNAADSKLKKEKREALQTKLQTITQKLNEVAARSSATEINTIQADCAAIERTLEEITEALKTAQGLRPTSLASREPVQC